MTRPTMTDDPNLSVVRVGVGPNTRLVTAKGRRGYLPGKAASPSGSPDPNFVDPRSGRQTEPGALFGPHPGWVDHTDTDTRSHGRGAPFEAWEADSRGLVGILWGFGHDGLMVTDPGLVAPLRHALFERLHARGGGSDATEDLIADLRGIVDAHDPAVTDGAPGAGYLSREEAAAAEDAERARRLATGEPLEAQVPADAAASSILNSRWRFALEAHAQARALVQAAREEEAAGFGEVANRLRQRAQDITGVPAALVGDRPAVQIVS